MSREDPTFMLKFPLSITRDGMAFFPLERVERDGTAPFPVVEIRTGRDRMGLPVTFLVP